MQQKVHFQNTPFYCMHCKVTRMCHNVTEMSLTARLSVTFGQPEWYTRPVAKLCTNFHWPSRRRWVEKGSPLLQSSSRSCDAGSETADGV